MTTDNPKVSAYVPQVLKERLKQFREERGISESQAVTIILAEYFQIPEVLGCSPERGVVGGVTLGRIEVLEERLANFAESVEQRLQQLGEEISRIGGLSVVHQIRPNEIIFESEQNDGLLSEPPSQNGDEADNLEVPQEVDSSSLSSEPLNEVIQEADEEIESNTLVDESDTGIVKQVSAQEVGLNLQPNGDSQNTEDSSSSPNEPLNTDESRLQLNLSGELPFELKSELPIEFSPLNSVKLSRRLGKGDQSVKHMKRKYKDDIEGFVKWIQEKDPDKIAWKYTSKGYVPIGELTQEQKNSLQKLHEENP
jgi:hypothetical protein